MGGRGGIGLRCSGALTIGYLEKILSINAVGESSRLMLTGRDHRRGRPASAPQARLKPFRRSPNPPAGLPHEQAHPIAARPGRTLGRRPRQAGPKHGDRWVVGMSQCNLGEPWRVQMNADIKEGRRGPPRDRGRLQGRAERHPAPARADRGVRQRGHRPAHRLAQGGRSRSPRRWRRPSAAASRSSCSTAGSSATNSPSSSAPTTGRSAGPPATGRSGACSPFPGSGRRAGPASWSSRG